MMLLPFIEQSGFSGGSLGRGTFFPFTGLNFVLAHGDGPLAAMKFEVKAAGIADGGPVFVSSPQGSFVGLAIGTRRIGSQTRSSINRFLATVFATSYFVATIVMTSRLGMIIDHHGRRVSLSMAFVPNVTGIFRMSCWSSVIFQDCR